MLVAAERNEAAALATGGRSGRIGRIREASVAVVPGTERMNSEASVLMLPPLASAPGAGGGEGGEEEVVLRWPRG